LTPYKAPSVNETAFNCPHCNALAEQSWKTVAVRNIFPNKPPSVWIPTTTNTTASRKGIDPLSLIGEPGSADRLNAGKPVLLGSKGLSDGYILNLNISHCYSCKNISVWAGESLIYPYSTTAPQPNADLSEDIRSDYIEAAAVLTISPRSSAALLRLVVQKLCIELDYPGKDLNADIGAMVAKGLNPYIQKALDAVRVIGNNAVHPGRIDLRDDRDTALGLFKIVNLIAEKLISEPKQVEQLYGLLPDGALEAIDRRDNKG
jgi:hypothetical protein